MIALLGADMVKEFSTSSDKKLGIENFFSQKKMQLAHLSNIPDISWRESLRQSAEVIRTNGPTHYIDLEFLLGIESLTKKNKSSYKQTIRNLPTDYNQIIQKFLGQTHPLDKNKNSPKTLSVFFDIGTAPWRVQELYKTMVKAFACAKERESNQILSPSSSELAPTLESQLTSERRSWVLPFSSQSQFSTKHPFYQCQSDQTRLQALSAALVAGGILAHFVGDLAQPYHTTINYDGWLTDNGKVHEYFETSLVNELDDSFSQSVSIKALSPIFAKKFEKEMSVNWMDNDASLRFSWALAAHSWEQVDRALILDRKYALRPSSNKDKKQAPARLSPSTKSVIRVFQPLLIEQFAIGARSLAKIWYQAWSEGGKPNLSEIQPLSFPYILDVPYLWPTYDSTLMDQLGGGSAKKENKE